MADLAHVPGQDLALTPSGDLQLVSNQMTTQQRLIRRLLTPTGSYIWHTQYGAGLPLLVGQPISEQQVAGIVRSQLELESGAGAALGSRTTLKSGPSGQVYLSITYKDQGSAVEQALEIPLEG